MKSTTMTKQADNPPLTTAICQPVELPDSSQKPESCADQSSTATTYINAKSHCSNRIYPNLIVRLRWLLQPHPICGLAAISDELCFNAYLALLIATWNLK